jgi:hypothetical protein
VQVIGNTRVRASLPVGVDGLANPLAYSSIAVTNAFGSGARERAFRFDPSLATGTVFRIGSTAELRIETEPFALYQVLLGGIFPDFGVPLPPYDGALVILSPTLSLTPLLVAPENGRVALPLPIPNDPTLVGAELNLQAFTLTGFAPLAGGFTNRLAPAILP